MDFLGKIALTVFFTVNSTIGVITGLTHPQNKTNSTESKTDFNPGITQLDLPMEFREATVTPPIIWSMTNGFRDGDYYKLYESLLIPRGQTHSSYLWATITVPKNAKALVFEFIWTKPGNGDYLSVQMQDDPLFIFIGKDSGQFGEMSSNLIDIQKYRGQTKQLLFTLNGIGGIDSEVKIKHIDFVDLIKQPNTWYPKLLTASTTHFICNQTIPGWHNVITIENKIVSGYSIRGKYQDYGIIDDETKTFTWTTKNTDWGRLQDQRMLGKNCLNFNNQSLLDLYKETTTP